MILTDLATSKVGGKILFATDDFFAVGENMIAFEDPVWDAQKYTEFGTVWGMGRSRQQP